MLDDIKKTLWATADKLRANMDAAEYKHLVLGLIFLKYISDTFAARRAEVAARLADPDDEYYYGDAAVEDLAAELDDRDYYTSGNVFWVPEGARWETLRAQAKRPDIGKHIDDALALIEGDNPKLKGILDKRFARAQLPDGKLGELVDLVSTIGFGATPDVARDTLTARALLERVGQGALRDVLATPLQEAAAQLAPVVAAVPPERRAAWGDEARALLATTDEGSALHYEALVARLALEWVLASRHATDVLFEPGVRAAVDALVVLEGFQSDALNLALVQHWGASACCVGLWDAESASAQPPSQMALHAAADAEDEAHRAAACVLRHIEQGRIPVALAATDRALIRRVLAHLDSQGVLVRDESGWILSTTRSAARLMAALEAAAWNASSNAVLDWLKLSPAFAGPELVALERRLRRDAVRDWPRAAVLMADDEFVGAIEAVRASLQGTRSLGSWPLMLTAFCGGLVTTGLIYGLAQTGGGTRIGVMLLAGVAHLLAAIVRDHKD